MKANQSFYDTLREEVSQDKLRTSHSFLFWGRTIKSVDEPTTTSQASVGEKPSSDDESIRKLKEIIEGLQTQVELLEEAHRELIEKNKELEANMKKISQDQNFGMQEFSSAEKPILPKTMTDIVDKEQECRCHSGYIPLLNIIHWADEIVSEHLINIIKLMIYETCPSLTEEERKLVHNIGTEPLKRCGSINVGGDLIMKQDNTTKVDNVEPGAIGIVYK